MAFSIYIEPQWSNTEFDDFDDPFLIAWVARVVWFNGFVWDVSVPMARFSNVGSGAGWTTPEIDPIQGSVYYVLVQGIAGAGQVNGEWVEVDHAAQWESRYWVETIPFTPWLGSWKSSGMASPQTKPLDRPVPQIFDASSFFPRKQGKAKKRLPGTTDD